MALITLTVFKNIFLCILKYTMLEKISRASKTAKKNNARQLCTGKSTHIIKCTEDETPNDPV